MTRQTSYSAETAPRLPVKDLVLIGLAGVLACLILGAVADIPVQFPLLAALGLSGFVAAYARWRRPGPSAPSPARIPGMPHDNSLREQALLADGFAEAVIMINRSERIIYANPAAVKLFDLSGPGGTLAALVRNPDIRQMAADTLDGKVCEPVVHHTRSPVERHFRVMASAIDDGQPETAVRRAILVFYDITDIVRVNTMRADFLANASHELKTPVASLLGYIETLRGHAKDDPEAQEMFLGIMQQQAERMQRLIDDLLSLRRIELSEHIAPTETADLYLAARAAMEAVKPMAKKRKVKVKYTGPKSIPVFGIQDELVQLVLNILDNAVMVTPPDRIIQLTAETVSALEPGQVFSDDPEFVGSPRRRIVVPSDTGALGAILRIKDQGPGFGQEHLPRLGERFYKIEGAKRGTGLGLAIVKHIMRRHRGGLFIESREGTGTVFTILLPLNPDAQKAENPIIMSEA